MNELRPCPLCGENLIVRTSKYKGVNYHTAYCHCGFTFKDDGDFDDFIERLNRRAEPANTPLTLDELRGMDGERIWFEDLRGGRFSRYVDNFDIEDYRLDTYGKTWLAYRRKPEGSESK